MDVKLVDTPDAFDLPEWRSLCESDPNAHVFSTPTYNRVWWNHFGANKRLAVLLFLDPGPVAIVPLMSDTFEGKRRLRFLGGDDLSDYLGPIGAHGATIPPVAEALLSFLSDGPIEWDFLDAKCMPVPFGFAEGLAAAAEAIGVPFDVTEQELSAVLPLASDFEAYLQTLSKHQRHELRRKMRRFQREEPDAQLVGATAESLADDIERFIKLHRTSEGEKGSFMSDVRAEFFRELAAETMREGWLRLDFLRLRQHTIAATMSFDFDRVLYLYNSAYDTSLKSISPGLVLVTRLIERAIGLGHERFDFLRGRERYKFDLGAQPVPLHAVTIRSDG